jgi:hypothetical protein
MADPVLPAAGQVSVEIAATAEQVWVYACDPSIPARFSSELQEAAFVDETPPSLGAVIEGRNARGDFEWTTLSTVIAYEPLRIFSWATGDADDPAATWTFAIEPTGESLVLSHSVVFHAGKAPLAPAIEREPERAPEIVDGRMTEVMANMRATVEGIAALVNRNNGS